MMREAAKLAAKLKRRLQEDYPLAWAGRLQPEARRFNQASGRGVVKRRVHR